MTRPTPALHLVMALLHVASLLLCFGGLQYANAVGDTHIAGTSGKEFFFAFFANNYYNQHSYLENDIYVSSTSDSLCTIDYDEGMRNLISINITAYSVTRKRLRGTTHLRAKSGIENKGIRIQCTNPVSIYGYNRYTQNDISDAFTALPLAALSKEYIIPGVNNNPYIGVVATQNNTLVKIDLNSSCSISFHGSLYKTGDILAVSLNINDALQIIHKESYETSLDCDFGGTYIQSTAPVAVFSGSVFYYPNNAVNTYLALQVPPISAYSTTVIVPRVPSPANHTVVRLVGSQNETSVSIKSVSHTDVKVIQHSLNWREFKDIDFSPDADLLITCDKPIMVVQNTYFVPYGGFSMFVPGQRSYEKEFVVESMDAAQGTDPVCTIVCETSSIQRVCVVGAGSVDVNVRWDNITSTLYSVGSLVLQKNTSYHINSGYPIYVRVHEYASRATYSYNAGYQLSSEDQLKDAVRVQCLPSNWFVTMDLSKLRRPPSDVSHIYMATHACTGTLQGHLLVFNVSYNLCHTKIEVAQDKVIFSNNMLYTLPSSDNVTRDVEWRVNLECSHLLHEIDSVHIYPQHNSTNHITVSGQIQGSSVHISLFKDPAYQVPFVETVHKAQLGQPIFVQVSSPLSENTIMIINTCHAHLTNDSRSPVSHILIENGCPVDKRTKMLVSRDHLKRFTFDMFDLPDEDEDKGLYVTCNVTFCDQMDFSPNCQQGCQTHPDVGIIG